MVFTGWSELPAELINCIADRFLGTSDLDYYMDFRAVCHSWRSATDDPKSSPDPRFRPRHWVIIDRRFGGDKIYLWVNTATGRFVHKELPLPHSYRGSTTSTTPDGLLILRDRKSNYTISLLNAFTGYWIRFAAPPPKGIMESAALVSGSSPTLVLLCKKMVVDDDRKVYTAYPDRESFTLYEERRACPLVRLALRGIYTNGELGSVAPFPVDMAEKIFDLMSIYKVNSAESSDDEYTITLGFDGNRCYLVRSAGEILIIFKIIGGMEVYSMDTDSYILKRVENIGKRAIFLGGNCRCISVNADKFPSVDANCIYFVRDVGDYVCMYDLRSQRSQKISREMGRGPRPYTIIQSLSSCSSLKKGV